MIRATLDTNILVSAFFYQSNEKRVLQAAIQARFKSVTSPEILEDLEKVLSRLGVQQKEVEGFVLRIMEISDICHPVSLDDAGIRDRSDIKIIECALSGSYDYIVTGDQDLLSLRVYRGIGIVRSGRFQSLLDSE